MSNFSLRLIKLKMSHFHGLSEFYPWRVKEGLHVFPVRIDFCPREGLPEWITEEEMDGPSIPMRGVVND